MEANRRGRREKLCQHGIVFVLPPWTNVQCLQSKEHERSTESDTR